MGNFIMGKSTKLEFLHIGALNSTKKLINTKVRERAIWTWQLFSVPASSAFLASEQKDFGDLEIKGLNLLHSFF